MAKHSNHIFKPYGGCTSVGEGNGIGLYMIKTLIEYNGGYVRLQSEPGKGTTVYCYFKEQVLVKLQHQEV